MPAEDDLHATLAAAVWVWRKTKKERKAANKAAGVGR